MYFLPIKSFSSLSTYLFKCRDHLHQDLADSAKAGSNRQDPAETNRNTMSI